MRALFALLGSKARGLEFHIKGYRWARSELARVRADLPVSGVRTRAQVPDLTAPAGRRGVFRALAKTDQNCLERALVLQAWWSTSVMPAPDVVIGVRRGESILEAHAWVDGSDPWFDESYGEILRLRFTPDQ
ncbi:MAG: lasso peptide biosynthesis protein [Acidimicrobiales bacterium]